MRTPPLDLLSDQTRHIVIDLETRGTGAHAQIATIGAVRFTLHPEVAADSFYVRVAMDGDMDNQARDQTRSTLDWWDEQSKEARLELDAQPRVGLFDALRAFFAWAAPTPEDRALNCAWGNGPEFDIVILEDAVDNIISDSPTFRLPWAYWNVHSLRTAAKFAPWVKRPEFTGIKHHALHDAQHEARYLRSILGALQARYQDSEAA